MLRKVKAKSPVLVSAATTAIVAGALVDRRSAAAKRLKRRLEFGRIETWIGEKANATTSGKASAKVGAKVAVEAQLGVERGVHVDVAGASAHVDVAGAKTGVVANDQWQTAVDPKTGGTYYYNTETGSPRGCGQLCIEILGK